jgi:hypothetical protein
MIIVERCMKKKGVENLKEQDLPTIHSEKALMMSTSDTKMVVAV